MPKEIIINEDGNIELVDNSLQELYVDGYGLIKRYDILYNLEDGIIYSYEIVSVYPDALEVYRDNYDNPNGRGQQYIKPNAEELYKYIKDIDIAKIEQYSKLDGMFKIRIETIKSQLKAVEQERAEELSKIDIDALCSKYPERFI